MQRYECPEAETRRRVNTILQAGGRLVIYSDSLKFVSQFPTVTNKIGPLCFKLNNAGQNLLLYDKDNKLIKSITYSDAWQCTTDGNGRTLQLVSPTSNANLSSSWFAACMGGSPGVPYSPCIENTIYSEINYNSISSADAGDWIELYNKSNTTLNLSNWTLKDGINTHSFIFPNGTTILPNKYLVVYADATKFNSQFPTVTNKVGPFGYGLSSSGDVLRLYNATGK